MAWYAVNMWGDVIKIRKETKDGFSLYVPCDDEFDICFDVDKNGNPKKQEYFHLVSGNGNAKMVSNGVLFMRSRIMSFMDA